MRAPRSRTHRLSRAPEAHIATFAFLLNYPWEMLQAPLFEGLSSGAHWEQVRLCTAATFADALISLMSYWTAAVVSKSRSWLLRPPAKGWVAHMAAGLAITVAGEALATGPLGLWDYAPTMPLLPGAKIGLGPVLQWLILPPLIVWFARNQVMDSHGSPKASRLARLVRAERTTIPEWG